MTTLEALEGLVKAHEWIVERDADHRKFGCVHMGDKWHCSEYCAVGKARAALDAWGKREPLKNARGLAGELVAMWDDEREETVEDAVLRMLDAIDTHLTGRKP